MSASTDMETAYLSTGITGLDRILRGGLPANRLYLVEGTPGSGKTTLSLQFLLEGARAGEPVLYVTLSETSEELRAVAASHGWELAGITLFELASADAVLGVGRDQSILHSWEMELGNTIQLIKDEVQRLKPRRVVFDSLSEMRLLAQDPLRYRRQLLFLKQFFAGFDATVLLVDDLSGFAEERDSHLHSLCHGVITLERLTLDFGAARRRTQVQKLRGVDFVAGYHDFIIRRGGIDIFPRLIASDHHKPFVGEPVSSGVPALDAMLNGGPARGTSTLITGPAGSGKTTLALQYLAAACERGECATIYEFDERIGTLIARAKALGIDLQSFMDKGYLVLRQVDPAEISPGQFAAMVREEVEKRQARFILIDSLNGYLAAMPQEQHLVLQLHELLSYLNQAGALTFLINPQQGFFGTMQTHGLNVSYVADVVILLRFFEAQGRIRKAISIVKNRSGGHEDAIRELRIDSQGLRVGEPLADFRGVLTGTPEYVGSVNPLLEGRHATEDGDPVS
ncbi:circadian clock protein KaiC [Azorhizobium oxalatiphilum]|uniref:non-specific serine/threonine protein kinase n=1 Tax=Azorhizobium oxalatiphilum TaxID=980631 RepID=A0A917CE29_9HYPH|nr:ATPase domain-containing protein [Azorhizobium oxalatiphilum]GGF82094.1 circadian clock protein KaiC [Azorhizobium oxalatiphilum]